MLDAITPVLLTWNESANIGRTLAKLAWARDIVVVDSGSTDETLQILKDNPRVRLFERKFDNHPNQWRYAVGETGIGTPWVLRLDADYQLPEAFVVELASIDPAGEVSAYIAEFDYAVFSQKLIASLYPPKPVLLRQSCYTISDEGHTEGWVVRGAVGKLRERIEHDDWKSMRDWVVAQARYMTLERNRLKWKRAGLRDWLRMHPPLMPIAVFFYCLVWKRLLFSGRAGLLYTLQRTLAEGILALFILENALMKRHSDAEQGVWEEKKAAGTESAGAG